MSRPKKRTCRICRSKFEPRQSIQPTCDKFECKVAYAEKVAAKSAEKRAKDHRKKTREQKLEAKPIQYFRRRAEAAVNAFVRERDRDEPCISCRTYDSYEWHAGHFVPVGRASSIRYDPANIHKQCFECNTHKGGNATLYEKFLTIKIGAAEVDRLKNAPRIYEWTREECLAIEAFFKEELRKLKESRA